MNLSKSEPIPMYCHNCGRKVMGCRSRDRTARFACERCGMLWVSRRMDARIVGTRSTAPPERSSAPGQWALF